MKHLGMILYHCMEGVRIRSYSGPHFLAFGLNTERYGVSLHIKSEFGEIRNRITPNRDTFHVVYTRLIFNEYQKKYLPS